MNRIQTPTSRLGACDGRSLPRRCGSRNDAFSLVEVTLAIGIVAFAFVAIFGLIPVGLSTFRQAIDTSVGSQIVQRLINEAQQTDYSKLIAVQTPTLRNFDDQGNEITAAAIAEGKNYIYTAQLTVTAPTELPNTSTPPTESLATVVVKLATNPGHNPDPFAADSKVAYSTHTALIAKNQ